MSKLRPSYFVALLAIIAFVAGYFIIIKKQKTVYLKLEEEYKNLTVDVSKARAVAERKNQAMREYWLVTKRWEKANQMLPKQGNIPDILRDINKLAGAAGVKINLFKPKAPIPKEKYTEIPLDIEVTGTYHEIARFLAYLNNMERIVNVSSIDLTPGKEETWGLQAKMSAIAYIGQGGVKHEKGTKKKRRRR